MEFKTHGAKVFSLYAYWEVLLSFLDVRDQGKKNTNGH